jgi:hypothetical protein
LALAGGVTLGDRAGGAAMPSVPSSTSSTADSSEFIGDVLAFLRASGGRFPDALQPRLADTELKPDLFYDLSTGLVCVFCDTEAPAPDVVAQRDDLADAGYRVIVLRQASDLARQLRQWPDVFGSI